MDRIRVLLIEDDEDDYVFTRDLLAEIGGDRFDLEWAPTYERGLARVLEDRFDVCLLDFRLEFVNDAAAAWAGVERSAMIGLITGELLPEFRSSGYFDTLREVVETGRPYHHEGALVDDTVIGGAWVGGIYDMRAIRLGDGYVSTWRRQAVSPGPG